MNSSEVYIGIDFGTSFSKICYSINQDRYIYQRNNDPFIPTEVFYSRDTKKVFKSKPENERSIIQVKYFKYTMAFDDALMDKELSSDLPLGFECQDLNILFSVFFLGCIIQEVKRHIENKGLKISDINMAAPINDYRGEIYDLYYNVFKAAYIISENSELSSMHIDKIKKVYDSVKSGHQKSKCLLSIHPELFIEAVYFTNDILLGLDYGSYMIMDIGGGTVDIGILWKREWERDVKFDLVVVNILKYGVEIIEEILRDEKITPDEVKRILSKNDDNGKTKEISKSFMSNIEKMISIESKTPMVGIQDIENKRIYYTGGGSSFQWYKQQAQSVNNSIITEDKIPFKLFP